MEQSAFEHIPEVCETSSRGVKEMQQKGKRRKTMLCTERCRAVDGMTSMVSGLWKPGGREAACCTCYASSEPTPPQPLFLVISPILLGEDPLTEICNNTRAQVLVLDVQGHTLCEQADVMLPLVIPRSFPICLFIILRLPFCSIRWKSICDSHDDLSDCTDPICYGRRCFSLAELHRSWELVEYEKC